MDEVLNPFAGVGGFVLAGGQSSRMGRDKALLELAGKPLIEHAVAKLRRVCSEVAVCSGNPLLGRYARLIPDVHAGCGPMGAMEAALLRARYHWNLFLPVDVPFLPTVYLSAWMRLMDFRRLEGARAMIWTVDGRPQPAVALVHRDVGPYLGAAIERGEYKLRPVLENAANLVAVGGGFVAGSGFLMLPYWREFTTGTGSPAAEPWRALTDAQRGYREHWFDNLNTPGEFAEAERHTDALDT